MFAIIAMIGVLGQVDLKAFGASLPQLNGEARVQGLQHPVTVERDALGIPTIRGQSIEDVYRAEGFLHGQDRFFQIDALRRLAAGELAEVVGPAGLVSDLQFRKFRFRAAAEALFTVLPAEHRRLLEIYTEGVNAGLTALKASPPEYTVLQTKPQPWQPTDTLLVQYTMFSMLNFDKRFEPGLGLMKEVLPSELFDFLTPESSRFDVPLLGSEDQPPVPKLPGPAVVNVRAQKPLSMRLNMLDWPDAIAGSNNWAVAGSRTNDGRAILANDPHLPITVPNIWYRVQIEWNGGHAEGVSLPGVPGVLVGSNGFVSWGVTNVMGDFQDMILIEVDPNDSSKYRTPDGMESFSEITEQIKVHGKPAQEIKLQSTRWGIVTEHDWKGRPLVLKWTALDPTMVNMGIVDMIHAKTLDDAAKVARHWYGPPQNVLMADTTGRIGWIVSGYLPNRKGFDGKSPVSWAEKEVGWDGQMPEEERPMLLDPPSGILFTANNRTVDTERARKLGHLWDIGLRANRIFERLSNIEKMTENDLRDVQLDIRSKVHDFYRDLILEVTAKPNETDTTLHEARALAQKWNGTADADQVAYTLLRAYRNELHRSVLEPLMAPVMEQSPEASYFWLMAEEPVRQILEARPMHLLAANYENWDQFLRSRLEFVIKRLKSQSKGGATIEEWGKLNLANIIHPATQAAPMMSAMLDMPRDPMSGDNVTVRVATPMFSASMRMVVSPSHEADGLLHMPCGASGHPLSPHYRDGHEAWVKGLPTAFLADKMKHKLMLLPRE